ncbi:sugar ABC transporter substrate-binding protein [Synechococcus elongatus]|uniref:ABC transporter substrate-binding protein n=1 Tax=Synechococcus elongatus TaxID=32046 RepID=UPI0030CB6D2D
MIRSWRRCCLAVILVGLLLGCARSSQSDGEIVFWTMQLQPKFTPFFNELIDRFEQENPGARVRWVDIPWSAMESKILTAVSAGTAPDVVNLNPVFASQLAARGALLDLNQAVTPEQRDRYLPNIWQASSLQGQAFGLPWYLTTRITIFNRNLMQQAGLQKPPATYAELAIAAKQIRDRTGKYAFFVTFVPEDSGEVLESMVQMGVKLVDDQGKAAFNTPEGIAAFRYWVDLYQQGLLPQESLTQGHRRAVELYQSGEIALLQTGPEFLNAIATNAPAIAAVSAPAPQLTGETGKCNVAVMNIVVPQDASDREIGLKFALYVTDSANQLSFAKAANVLPSTTASLKDYRQQLRDRADISSTLAQARSISAAQMDTAQVLVPAAAEMKELQRLIYENLQAAMLERKTVEQAVADAAAAWNSSR